VLHIGPHKTGTTAVQSAFRLARRAAEAQGVLYLNPDGNAAVPVQAAIDPGRAARPGLRRWRRLLWEIERSSARQVVLSSEWFADADADAVGRIVDEVGRDRAHVVVTVRALERILPSQWQQYVAGGFADDYESWLRSVLEAPDSARRPSTPTFWRRHRHDELVARWADVVGSHRVTVIVVDEADHSGVLRAFEGLTGLRAGTLIAERDRSNRSLTLPEAELVRAFNQLLKPERLSEQVRLNLGLYGASASLRARTTLPGEPKIATPAWALDRADSIGAEIVDGIRASGVDVIGSLASLAAPAVPRRSGPSPALDGIRREVWLDVASTAALGVLITAGQARARRHRAAERTTELLGEVSTGRLARVVVHRVRSLPATLTRRASGAPSDARGRQPTEVETEVVRSFEAAVLADGLPKALPERVIREGVLPEMLRLPRAQPETEWRDAGARLAIGVVRAAGLLPSRPVRHRRAGLANVETLEVGRVSTLRLGLLVARRVLTRGLRGRQDVG
jgi:hypothetical protein